MLNKSDALISKLLAAHSVKEVSALLKAAGEDEGIAQQIWDEICAHRKDKELSLKELEAISGGADRDWPNEGCAATVEPGSRCGSNDACWKWDVTYEHAPVNGKCNRCGGALYYLNKDRDGTTYKCVACGNEEYR